MMNGGVIWKEYTLNLMRWPSHHFHRVTNSITRLQSCRDATLKEHIITILLFIHIFLTNEIL